MTQNYTGMRKGISLVEMIIAVILFGALAVIGLKYSKSYINTELQAMKARSAAAAEQAAQLTAAYKIYKLEYGELTAITDLNSSLTQVMTSIPVDITEMTTSGWDFNASIDGGSLKAFIMPLDANKTSTSDEQYCALWNRDYNTSTELNVSDNQDFGDIAGAVAAGYTNFCYGTAGTYTIVVTLP